MQRIRVDIAYDGSQYLGWQRQTYSSETIQETIEHCLELMFAHPIRISASGRTDAGVHAKQQVFHFDTFRDLSKYNLVRGLQKLLPPSISVKNIYLVPNDFHARYSAIAKEYRYYLYTGPKNPFKNNFFCHWNYKLNIELLETYSSLIIGNKDFASFQNKGTPVKTTYRQIYYSKWQVNENKAVYTVIGSGFLKQMVRNLVGTMLHFQQKELKPSVFNDLLLYPDRSKAKEPAPPKGLFLQRLYYPRELDNKCLKL